MRILLIIFCMCFASLSWSQSLPEHASENPYGSGWKCDRGYYKSGNKCEKVQIPENAGLDVYGSGWKCNRGYYKSGNTCVEVQVPKNAGIDVYGSGWKCNRGYYKSGNTCVKVQVPENAGIDVYGSGWKCNRGYYKFGNKCVKVQVPENASIDIYGSGWKCNRGFKKVGSSCKAMTQQELQRQIELEKAAIAEMQRRRAQGVSGDDCDTEYKTNAEVCVEITGGDIDCNESYSGNYYNDCDVSLNYEVNTDYSGGAYLDVEVECTVEIEYKGRNTYSTQSDSSYGDESHDLYAHDSDSETLNFNFSFGSYQEVTSAKISSAECEIDSVDLY
ncbi:hypothetical protein [Idiomarina sp.]|uniref:hypothetical protein n=1 Tax=Idiomarina sp. TaxID=1874361 RepID=UPI003A8F7AEF